MAQTVIERFGLSCTKITVKFDVGEVSIVTDPFGEKTGLRQPRSLAGDILLVSDEAEKKEMTGRIEGSPFVISHPGEYESKGIFVYGIPAPMAEGKKAKDGSRTIYRIEAGDITIGYLGALQAPLTDAEFERFAEVDVLLLPIGGQGLCLTATQAVDVLTRLEPRLVIPTWYLEDGLTLSVDPLNHFVKECGLVPETMERLKLAKKDLPQEETKLVVLSL